MRFHLPAHITNLLRGFQNLSLFYQPKQKYFHIFYTSADRSDQRNLKLIKCKRNYIYCNNLNKSVFSTMSKSNMYNKPGLELISLIRTVALLNSVICFIPRPHGPILSIPKAF